MARPFARFSGAYVRYWFGASASILGSSISTIAYPLLVIALGGSAAAAGAVATVSLITRTAFRLPAGHVSDLVSRRALMIGSDLARLIALGSIPAVALVGTPSYGQLLGVAVVEGLGTALYQPAYTVMLRDLVPAELLTPALSQSSTTIGAIAMFGPLVGGALFAFDHTLPFTIDAASYLVSLVLMLTVRSPAVDHSGDPAPDRRVTAGLRWLWGNPAVIRVLVLVGVYNLVAAGADVPVLIALRRQGESGAVYGAVLGGAGVGVVIGGLLAPKLIDLLAPRKLHTVIGAIWVVGTTMFALSIGPWVMGVLLAALMALAPTVSIQLTRSTLDKVPRSMIGRVTTAQGMVIFGLSGFGPGLTGVLLDVVDIPGTWLILAVMCLLATLLAVVPAESLVPVPTGGVAGD
jgi:MFS family permease